MFFAVIGRWGESWFLMLCFRDSMRNVMLESGEMMFFLFFYLVKSPYLYSKKSRSQTPEEQGHQVIFRLFVGIQPYDTF